ncbi:hypothetical protein SK128_012807, partial [Halocaridina rubra]
ESPPSIDKKMSKKKSSTEHQPSILLSKEANTKIFSLLEPKTQALSTAVVTVVISRPPKHPEWRQFRTGVAVLIKDYARKSYYVQIYDIVDWERLREEELIKGTAYHASLPKFHQFEAEKGQTMGLKFASEDEARKFAEIARIITMTGLYKTDGGPPSPIPKSEEKKSHQKKDKCVGTEVISESEQNHSSAAPPPPSSSTRRGSLLPPPPPPQVKKDQQQTATLPAPLEALNTDASSHTSPRPSSSAPTTSYSSPNESNLNEKRPKCKRLTKDMISNPTDFKHLYHVGFQCEAPIDEKALRAAVGSRPPAPSRPPPPPPPGKRPAGRDSQIASNGEKDKANNYQEPPVDRRSEIPDSRLDTPLSLCTGDAIQTDLDEPLIDSFQVTPGDSSFANELIEEYMKRSSFASDALVATEKNSNKTSTSNVELVETENVSDETSTSNVEMVETENISDENPISNVDMVGTENISDEISTLNVDLLETENISDEISTSNVDMVETEKISDEISNSNVHLVETGNISDETSTSIDAQDVDTKPNDTQLLDQGMNPTEKDALLKKEKLSDTSEMVSSESVRNRSEITITEGLQDNVYVSNISDGASHDSNKHCKENSPDTITTTDDQQTASELSLDQIEHQNNVENTQLSDSTSKTGDLHDITATTAKSKVTIPKTSNDLSTSVVAEYQTEPMSSDTSSPEQKLESTEGISIASPMINLEVSNENAAPAAPVRHKKRSQKKIMQPHSDSSETTTDPSLSEV